MAPYPLSALSRILLFLPSPLLHPVAEAGVKGGEKSGRVAEQKCTT